eukprot:1878700-Prymnesium_polylepis.2
MHPAHPQPVDGAMQIALLSPHERPELGEAFAFSCNTGTTIHRYFTKYAPDKRHHTCRGPRPRVGTRHVTLSQPRAHAQQQLASA